MMRTMMMLMLAAFALAVLATPAQADVKGQLEQLVGGPVPPQPGCNDYDLFSTRLCYRADSDCTYVGFRSDLGQGTVFGC